MDKAEQLKMIREILQAINERDEYSLDDARSAYETAKEEYGNCRRGDDGWNVCVKYLRYCYAHGRLLEAEKMQPVIEEKLTDLNMRYAEYIPPGQWNVLDLLRLETLLRK